MNDSERLMRLIDGFVATQLLYVVAKLGIADALADGPKSSTELAASAGADPAALLRVLRGLAAEEVFDELDDGRFALGPLGEALRPLQGAAIARGEVYYDSAAGLFEAVLRGGVPYELTHRERFFEHLGQHPSRESAFQGSMAGRAELEARRSLPRTTSHASRRSLTSAAAGECSLPRCSTARRAFAARFSIAPPRSPTHACTSRKRVSPIGRSASPVTSSPSCREAPTPTFSRASSTIGPMPTQRASSRPAGGRCGPTARS